MKPRVGMLVERVGKVSTDLHEVKQYELYVVSEFTDSGNYRLLGYKKVYNPNQFEMIEEMANLEGAALEVNGADADFGEWSTQDVDQSQYIGINGCNYTLTNNLDTWILQSLDLSKQRVDLNVGSFSPTGDYPPVKSAVGDKDLLKAGDVIKIKDGQPTGLSNPRAGDYYVLKSDATSEGIIYPWNGARINPAWYDIVAREGDKVAIMNGRHEGRCGIFKGAMNEYHGNTYSSPGYFSCWFDDEFDNKSKYCKLKYMELPYHQAQRDSKPIVAESETLETLKAKNQPKAQDEDYLYL